MIERENLRTLSYYGWQGTGKRPLAAELAAAVSRYQERAGRRPVLALVQKQDGLGASWQGIAIIVAPEIVKSPLTIYLHPPAPARPQLPAKQRESAGPKEARGKQEET